MRIILKITKFIAHLSLSVSVFLFLQRKKFKLNPINLLIGAICIASLFIHAPQVESAFNEGIAIDTKAISLANNVTANPPGTGSMFYNPAGLSLMGNGTFLSLGLIPVHITKSGKFETDDSHVAFHDYKGDKIEDPLAGEDVEMKSPLMYIPILNDTLPALTGPIFGVSHRTPGSNWTFGYTTFAQYGGGWEFGDDDPAIYGGKRVYIQHMVYAAPAVSYRVNNNLSFGATFGVGQTVMGINLKVRAPNEIVNITRVLGDATQDMSNPIFDLTVPMPLFAGGIGVYDNVGTLELNLRDDFSPSYILGALWEPWDWITFGLCYQSAVKAHMSGKWAFEYSDDWQRMVAWSGSTAVMQISSIIFDLPYNVEAKQAGTVNADIEFPQIINFGIKIKPIRRLSLMGELHWAEWSSIQEDDIRFDQKVQLLQLAKFMGYTEGDYNMKMTRKFKDTLNWGVAAEYQLLDWLQLRAGYEYRKTSTVPQYYDLLYAMPTMHYFGAGMGVKWKSIDVDLALGYLVSETNKVEAGSSINMSSYVLGAGVSNPYRGLNYEEKMAIYMGSLKVTMPLDLITDPLLDLLPREWSGLWQSFKDKKVLEPKAPVDSSIDFINTMRFENKYYFVGNSE